MNYKLSEVSYELNCFLAPCRALSTATLFLLQRYVTHSHLCYICNAVYWEKSPTQECPTSFLLHFHLINQQTAIFSRNVSTILRALSAPSAHEIFSSELTGNILTQFLVETYCYTAAETCCKPMFLSVNRFVSESKSSRRKELQFGFFCAVLLPFFFNLVTILFCKTRIFILQNIFFTKIF